MSIMAKSIFIPAKNAKELLHAKPGKGMEVTTKDGKNLVLEFVELSGEIEHFRWVYTQDMIIKESNTENYYICADGPFLPLTEYNDGCDTFTSSFVEFIPVKKQTRIIEKQEWISILDDDEK